MQALKTRTVTKATLFGGNKNKGGKGGKGKPAKRQAAPKRAATKRKVAPKPKRGAAQKKQNDSNVFDFDFGKLFDGEAYKEGAAAGGTDLAPAQKAVGYKATGARGSAPDIDAQGNKSKLGGRVYQFADKYGGNIDEYSPIWTPETRAPGGDVYEPGLAGLAVWFIGFTGLLLTGGFAIYTTSALAN